MAKLETNEEIKKRMDAEAREQAKKTAKKEHQAAVRLHTHLDAVSGPSGGQGNQAVVRGVAADRMTPKEQIKADIKAKLAGERSQNHAIRPAPTGDAKTVVKAGNKPDQAMTKEAAKEAIKAKLGQDRQQSQKRGQRM